VKPAKPKQCLFIISCFAFDCSRCRVSQLSRHILQDEQGSGCCAYFWRQASKFYSSLCVQVGESILKSSKKEEAGLFVISLMDLRPYRPGQSYASEEPAKTREETHHHADGRSQWPLDGFFQVSHRHHQQWLNVRLTAHALPKLRNVPAVVDHNPIALK
jgi:hypothetical protein